MKSIEERALEYAPEYQYDSDITIPNYELSDIKRKAFIDRVKSEHEELTKWNSRDNPPNNAREVLIKITIGYVVMRFDVARYYDEGCLDKGWYVEGNLYTDGIVVGWREIHE